MPLANANGLQIEYEMTGDGVPLVLVMGLGAQLVYWPDGFCAQLVDRGFQVIRFDHRDVGLSSKLEHAGPLRFWRLLARWLVGLPVEAPYTLIDMADDVVGLLDALQIDRAHIVGISMGGMIGQIMALRHPERLLTLTSLASHTGERRWFAGSPGAVRVLLGPRPRDRDEALASAVAFYTAVQSTAWPFDEQLVRERAGRAFDRCFYPRGFGRHLAAVLATGGRSRALRFVRVPTLVVHGTADPLVRPAAGRATARAIPGARLRLIEGLGHELPEGAWPTIVQAIAEHARAQG